MKLTIQIPCYNEEKTLPITLADLPSQIPGIDIIEVQIIDDGSTDDTRRIAELHKVNHIVSFKKHRGLAEAFKFGVDNALSHGADILVNTDADNQYCGADIAKLVKPIIDGSADVVIGSRPIDENRDFSFTKKILQKIGSWVLRKISLTTVKDSASGFRAYSKNALLRLQVYSEFSYCVETLIQAGFINLKIVDVDIRVNPKMRESRLFGNIFEYIWKQGKTVVTIFILYRANIIFNVVALGISLLSLLLVGFCLFLVIFHKTPINSLWPLVMFSASLFIIGTQIFFVGILASLVSSLRKLSEDSNYRIKSMEIRERESKER